ncbi:(Na+)-NQR maturation NqrM [Glaciecola petra]|uniref:(Na+)-NQR maturation NqrM n=1 Tax=Glaciecola petra TaxID=3075602 RepID=A0ABU2ZV80_9ALTE|nr:(Na+)-NQR maturation NqrM [Aestuariibacter sp. P117]MDT0596551.1 (Na+)-NQR maturation NqrM [Aestuariibacter sp. P117]
MSTFILAFGFFLLMSFAMAIGYILQKKSISGSCGGLGALGVEKACDCPEPCDRKKARLEKEALRKEKLKDWKDNQIL